MTDLVKSQVSSRGWLGFQALAFAGFLMFVLTNVRPIEVGAAVAATGLLLGSRFFGAWSDRETRTMAVGFSLAAFLLVVGLVAGPWRPYILVTSLFVLPLAIGCVLVVRRGKVDDRGPRLAATAMLLLIVGLIGVLWIVPVKPPAADVLYLHRSAAEVLLDGRNPYTDAYSVNTNPFIEEGAEYTGYPYPPLALVAYAGSHLAFGDPRWASVIAMALVVLLVTSPWAQMTREQAGALIAVALVIVVNPWLGTIIWFGWTEPISLPLLLGAGLLWRRNPVASAVLLGLAFGTKQYFVVALPLLLLWSDSFRWKRLLIAGGVAALSLLPAVLIDPVAFWDATVAAALSAPIRLDSSGLAGVGLDLPMWLELVVIVGVTLWMARAAGGAARFLIALAAVLSVGFLIGFQAFPNYWFLVGTVAVLGVVTTLTSGEPSQPDAVELAERSPG